MPLTKLRFPPGIVKDVTDYALTGQWVDGKNVRFRMGFPERIGGWEPIRNLVIAYDTPIRATSEPDNPFDTVNTDATVTVNDTAHGASIGDTVIINGSTSVGGLDMNGSWTVGTVPGANSFTFEHTSTASSTVNGGGGTEVNIQYVDSSTDPIKFEPQGICRSLYAWRSNSLVAVGVGTDEFYYVYYNGVVYEVTPLRETQALTNPFDVTDGDNTVTVNDTAHGAALGDTIIISGADNVGGLYLNGTWTISNVPGVNSYEFEHTIPAVSTVSGGGGASVSIDYIYRAGGTVAALEGWGAGSWSGGSWGESDSSSGSTSLGLITQAPWGEDAVICARNKYIALYDISSVSTRCVLLADLPGASDPPDEAVMVIASTRDRHMLALGASEPSGGSQNKMLIRWCDSENLPDWDVTSTTNTAGELLLDHGSEIITGRATRREILIWTDVALYSVSYIGAPFIFGQDLLAMNTDIAGINCATVTDDIAFWIGYGGFYAWTGQVEKIPCPIWDYIDQDINWSQSDKIYCNVNRKFTEVIWHYPSVGSEEVDKYVCYEYKQQTWYTGEMTGGRTAWLDNALTEYPLAAGTDNTLYVHENAADDDNGSSQSGVDAYIESAPFEIDEGEHFMFIRRILHDVTFRDSGPAPTPEMTMTLSSINYPGGGILDAGTGNQVARSATVPVEKHTTKTDIRLRGRSIIVKAESSTRNSLWRLGTPRIEVRPDGKR